MPVVEDAELGSTTASEEFAAEALCRWGCHRAGWRRKSRPDKLSWDCHVGASRQRDIIMRGNDTSSDGVLNMDGWTAAHMPTLS